MTTKPDAVAPIPDDLKELYSYFVQSVDPRTLLGINVNDVVELRAKEAVSLIERIAQAEQRAAKAEAENTRLREALKTINRMSSYLLHAQP